MKNIFRSAVSLFASKSERELLPYRARIGAINAIEGELQALSDDDLRTRFADLRTRRDNGEKAAAQLNETFAVVREASMRTLNMRHFDAQLLGGMALFDGKIAEMKTGEGKTLVATLPVCLEAMSGGGVHVVTVNDYLAQRDSDWMGVLYRFLGLSVGVNLPNMEMASKMQGYQSDITYGTNNEFGFDYLRHNMRYTADGIQRELNFAIVDEVDSILIDESRTPLIISGESNENVTLYQTAATLAKKFRRCANPEAEGDFILDEKARTAHLTDAGFERAEKLFVAAGVMPQGASLYESANLPLLHHLDVALRARHLFLRDRDYVVQGGEVVIVDEFTGRLMRGRRWGDNQHQAVEAKEGVAVQKESQTLASISFQNYFRLYRKLAGMTGTALTEAEEFNFIYGLQTVEIPTHRQMVRRDELDKIYQTAAAKNRALLKDIKESVVRGQPVLVGTTAIEDSEKLARMLQKEKLPHNVLNAKQHASEAKIIEQAGAPGAVTIATNMAGRGTDIVLGGNVIAARAHIMKDDSLTDAEKERRIQEEEEDWKHKHEQVLEAGGLRIIGTERHESRRIDNQLRGRSGRQGDPGSSIFYLSFEDSLLRIFATKHVSALMEKIKLDEDEAIEAKMVSRTIENAQRKVESHNFDIRRQLLEYDDIANEQRQRIYEQREEILQAEDVDSVARQFRLEHMHDLMEEYMPSGAPEEEWRAQELERLLASDYRLDVPLTRWLKEEDTQQRDYFVDKLTATTEAVFAEKFAGIETDKASQFMRMLILNILDDHWRGHLAALDNLRLSIGFRGMAQKNPKQEYKRESFEMFQRLLKTVQLNVAKVLYALSVKKEDEAPPPPPTKLQYRHDTMPSAGGVAPPADGAGAPPASPAVGEAPVPPVGGTLRRSAPKIRRNDPCPCGSGKKYKNCHGRI